MPLKLTCPNSECGAVLKVSDALANKAVRCPKCGQTIGSRAPATLDLPNEPATKSPARTLALSTDLDSTSSPLAETNPPSTKTFEPTAKVPQRIGRFEIRERLGEGAFGVVYRAYDTRLEREVALKVAKAEQLKTKKRAEQFLQEAKSAANLRHPNIVPVYDSGEDGERYFIATAYIHGHTLQSELDEKEGAPLDEKRSVKIVRKLAEALAYAHQRGIVHCDVKPSNVMIDEHDEPMLADFGLARRQTKGDSEGGAAGTPYYMAPEQWQGKAQAGSDQYSLGIMLYQMLTGSVPFDGDMNVLRFLHLEQAPPSPRIRERKFNRDLQAICLKCLEKKAAQRYGSCQELADDLRRWQDNEPLRARPLGRAERFSKWVSRNPIVAALLLVVGLVTVVGAAEIYVKYRDAKEQESIALRNETEAKIRAEERDIAAKRADAETEEAKKQTKLAKKQLTETVRILDLSRLRESQTAFDNNLVQLARDTLADIAPENRCVGWRILNRCCEGSIFAMYGHTGQVNSAALSADGSRLVTGSSDTTARLWDARTGQVLQEFKGHTSDVSSVALAADGSRLVTGSSDKTARLWDTSTGQMLQEFKGHTGGVTSVVMSADGNRLVTGSHDMTARLWDTRTGRTIQEFKGQFGAVTSVVLSADDSRLVTGGSWDEMARLLITRTGQTPEFTARLWDTRTGQMLEEFKGHTSVVWSMALSADGSRLVTVSFAKPRLWDARIGQTFEEFKGHTNFVTSVALSADGSCLATGSGDTTARLWDVRTCRALQEFKGHTDSVRSVALSADGSWLVTGSNDKTARLWDARTGHTLQEFKGHTSGVTNVALSADRSRLIARDSTGKTLTWNSATGQTIPSAKPPIAIERSDWATDTLYCYIVVNDGVLRLPKVIEIDEEERQMRLWATRPDPDRHVEQRLKFEKENNAYAAALHRYFEEHARGVVAQDFNQPEEAKKHFAAAARMKPPVPKAVEIVPKK